MRTVIVGAGQAGAWVAKTLRELAPAEDIVLLGDETFAPYERPPLSKDVLSGAKELPPFLLSEEQARESSITMRLGVAVLSIDREAKSLELSDRTSLDYDRLVLTTGGRARVLDLPGIDLPGVHTLRTLQDAQRLKRNLQPEKRLLVVGGGWIGLEVAATAQSLGLHVTLIEGGDRLCARSLTPDVSKFLLERHRREGVDVQLGGALTAIDSTDDGALCVTTHLGKQNFDHIVVGIGLQPNTDLAQACGLDVDGGIVVDIQGRTSDSCIYAAGDVTSQPCPWDLARPGSRVRLESWANAQNQGIAVGRALAGLDSIEPDLPWFWSDQYDINLQVLGMPSLNATTVKRGKFEEEKFCLFQFVDGRLCSVIAVNMSRELKLAKRWIKAGISPTPSSLSDPGFRLDKFKASPG